MKAVDVFLGFFRNDKYLKIAAILILMYILYCFSQKNRYYYQGSFVLDTQNGKMYSIEDVNIEPFKN